MSEFRTYRGLYLVNIPCANDDPLPCAIVNKFARYNEYQVICLDQQRYTDWLLTVDCGLVMPFKGELDAAQKQLIDKRMH